MSKLDWRRKRRTPSRNRGHWFWTGAPCSPERTPGFPVKLSGVDELHAAFLNESRKRICRWRPVQEIRDHGPKTDSSNALIPWARTLALGRSVFAALQKRSKELRPVFFSPCTLGRTWGTRPVKRASVFAPTTATPTNSAKVGTQPGFAKPVCSCSSSNKINPTESNNSLIWTALAENSPGRYG